jgi:putative DNA primase/helicase
MRRLAGAAPKGGGCPGWLQFLGILTGGNRAYQDYLQRLVGYSLTGSIKESVIALLWGSRGAMLLFLYTLLRLHGTYAKIAAEDYFVSPNGDRHPTGVARFAGRRLMVANTIDEESSRWNERRLEALTSGDPVTARFTNANFFTYRPQFKVVFLGDAFPPRMDGMDRVRERLHLLPFHTPVLKRDLKDKFDAELDGIMAWAVAGAIEWYRYGLTPPPL